VDFDLDAYFARLEYRGPREANLATLRALQLSHLYHLPFENLSSWSGEAVSVEREAIFAKLVTRRRGGYCYEHNTLFAAALHALGFAPELRLARVRWQVPPEVVTGRSHLCLVVPVEGRRWLVDVGFGGAGPTAPLDLEAIEVQTTPHESRLLRKLEDGVVSHSVETASGDWSELYRVEPAKTYPVDVQTANWFTSTHPDSRFRTSLIVTTVRPDHRRVLWNRQFTVRFSDGRTETRTIDSLEALKALLVDEFDLPANDSVMHDLRMPPPETAG
jgi:N-hydroxyarylamine O-acetyltransferase